MHGQGDRHPLHLLAAACHGLEQVIRIGIVAALPAEAAAARAAVSASGVAERVTVVHSGIGAERAVRAGRKLLKAEARLILSFGVAGALHQDLTIGQIFTAREVMGPDDSVYATDADWLQRSCEAGIRTLPRCGSTDAPVPTPQRKQQLHRDSGAWAVDMESHALAAMAPERFALLRAVSDTASQSLPATLLHLVDGMGRFRPAGLPGLLAAGPGNVAAVLRAARDYRRALAALRLALTRMLDQYRVSGDAD